MAQGANDKVIIYAPTYEHSYCQPSVWLLIKRLKSTPVQICHITHNLGIMIDKFLLNILRTWITNISIKLIHHHWKLFGDLEITSAEYFTLYTSRYNTKSQTAPLLFGAVTTWKKIPVQFYHCGQKEIFVLQIYFIVLSCVCIFYGVDLHQHKMYKTLTYLSPMGYIYDVYIFRPLPLGLLVSFSWPPMRRYWVCCSWIYHLRDIVALLRIYITVPLFTTHLHQ